MMNLKKIALISLFSLVLGHIEIFIMANAQEPALPAGLSDEPDLPAGLFDDGIDISTNENITNSDYINQDMDGIIFDGLSGFIESRIGRRLNDGIYQNKSSLSEMRLHLDYQYDFQKMSLNLSGDLIYDDQAASDKLNLKTGDGLVDLRQFNLTSTNFDDFDIKLGRQILTWGTGDLLFINDLFPKDWNSFLLGRDVNYLKAPSDTIKISYYGDLINIDGVYSPQFNADRYIDGARLSYFSSQSGDIVGKKNGLVNVIMPDKIFKDDELALRLYGNYGSAEWAGYLYDGFWKSPAGSDVISGKAIFPRLRVYGASIRDNIFSGIASAEIGYYQSLDDELGKNNRIDNSQLRIMAGYEYEIISNLTFATQWYLESKQDYGEYLNNLASNAIASDKNRQMVTFRLNYLTHGQNINWSLFTFATLGVDDYYIRPNVSYKMDDNWTFAAGANIFAGQDKYRFWRQFKDNSNIYLSAQFGF